MDGETRLRAARVGATHSGCQVGPRDQGRRRARLRGLASGAGRGRKGADQAGLLARERGALASAWELGRPEGRWAERGERKERDWASSRVGLISGFGLVLVFLFL